MITSAVCLDYNLGGTFFSFYPLYEYEIEEIWGTIIYQNWGNDCLWPRKGKRYKVLVNKKDHDKVVAYQTITYWLVLGIVSMLLVLLWAILEWCL